MISLSFISNNVELYQSFVNDCLNQIALFELFVKIGLFASNNFDALLGIANFHTFKL
jgi:hypothetical protein